MVAKVGNFLILCYDVFDKLSHLLLPVSMQSYFR